jgi:predicted nucleotidyltransferase component of viral defense system
MYREKHVRRSEQLQLLLLDNLFAQSGSEKIIFQGGTALRWVYGATRFSEDLDFVTHLKRRGIESILAKAYPSAANACIAQFGPGSADRQIKRSRESAHKAMFVFRPERQRERIAVRLEFEMLEQGQQPEFEGHILRELPQVAGLVTGGQLILPYTSSIVLTETPEEILSDKIRALFERRYIKGRDIYNLWWIVTQMGVKPRWSVAQKKLSMYQARFVPARKADHFLTKDSKDEIIQALDSDLARFIPQNIFATYKKENFRGFIETLKQVTQDLMDQGMRGYFESDGR